MGFRGDDQVEEMVKVITSNGGIMELYAPITVGCITNEFPGHGIFRPADSLHNLNLAAPLPHNQPLHPGQVYYLLPLHSPGGTRSAGDLPSIPNSNPKKCTTGTKSSSTTRRPQLQQKEDDHRSYSDSSSSNSGSTSCSRTCTRATRAPYRMSFENPGYHGMLLKRSAEAAAGGDPEVLPRYNSTSSGVWKVRLVINPEQLSEILSQESRTEALIESVRTVAKCGGNNSNVTGTATATTTSPWVSSMAANYSNQCSVSSGWRTDQ